jgi:hypothetical protein
VPRKIIGTLTLSILNSVHTSISPIILYKSCSVATPEHSKPLPLENYARIVALAPDLRTVPLYGVTEFLHHSSTAELLSLLILIKGSYPSFKASLPCWKSSSALWLLGTQIHARSPRGSVPLIKATNDFWLVRNDPARRRIITT